MSTKYYVQYLKFFYLDSDLTRKKLTQRCEFFKLFSNILAAKNRICIII